MEVVDFGDRRYTVLNRYTGGDGIKRVMAQPFPAPMPRGDFSPGGPEEELGFFTEEEWERQRDRMRGAS